MNTNVKQRNATDALLALLALLEHAPERPSRNGRTRELTHVGVTLERPWEREFLSLARKPNLAAQIAETMWVIAGRNDVEWLSHYLPRAKDYSDDGVVWRGGYGPRIRHWNGIDQLEYVYDLLAKDPGSRQAIIAIWNPSVDTNPGKDLPCNDLLQFLVRDDHLDLHVFIRSNDIIWGWSGINAFEWSSLQEILAGMLGLLVGKLHFSITSLHIYEPHWERARRILDAGAVVYDNDDVFPTFRWHGSPSLFQKSLVEPWFTIEEQLRSGRRVRDQINAFPEPMLRSWLRVLEWWWLRDLTALVPLASTRLATAAQLALQPAAPKKTFLQHVYDLHSEKHAAYGDSWRRRGEAGILANIARKVDRLGRAETADETAADTALDLLVYAVKYRVWLDGGEGNPDEVQAVLEQLPATNPMSVEWLEADLKNLYTLLERSPGQHELVDQMILRAYDLAEKLWTQSI